MAEPERHSDAWRLSGNGWALLAGLLCIVLAVAGENGAIYERVRHEPPEAVLWSAEFILHIVAEVGVALFVAWFITYVIDRRVREREHEESVERTQQVSQDVLFAVLGLKHDPKYVSTVIESCVSVSVVRDEYDVRYTLRPIDDGLAEKLQVEPGRFVELTLRSSYTLRNITSVDLTDYKVGYSLAMRSSPLLQQHARVTAATIDRRSLSLEEIDKISTLVEDDTHKRYLFPVAIPAFDTVDIVIAAVSVKELSDNEVWRNFVPTVKRSKVSVAVDRRLKLSLGLRAVSFHKAGAPVIVDPGHDMAWTIDGPILPNESAVLWWRSQADDGLPPNLEGARGIIDDESKASPDTGANTPSAS